MNKIDELRQMAEKMLAEFPRNLNVNEWGGNFKRLLEELSIYQIELEHQNKELERSEREVALAHEEYIRLFESTPVGYVICDENRNIIRVNQTFINYFVATSLKNSQQKGKCFDSFIANEFKNSFILFCEIILKQKVSIPMELKLVDQSKKTHYVLITACVYDREKKYIALTVNDISMQKRMEDQLARAKDVAEQADRNKSRFLTNISHELRMPLETIIGYGALLEDPLISEIDKKNYVKHVVTTCKILLRLSDDVLDISTLESGEMPIRNSVVNIEKLCNDNVSLVSRKIIGKNILLNVRVIDVPQLWGDQFRLSQIIYAIFDHATTNINEGEIILDCRYSQQNEKYGVLILTFNGQEIFSSEGDFKQDFTHSIYRNHVTLGLFLVQRIVKAMKGTMIWEHPLNCLRIEIPVEKSPYKEQNCTPELFIKNKVSNTVQIQGKRCLLVDDVVMNLNVLGLMMKNFGYEPVLAMSGEEALKLVEINHFDLIITDLWMPKMNGEELVMMLRQNPKLDKVPIWAITADVESQNNFNTDFFDRVITKPINKEKLQEILIKVNNIEK